MRLVIFLIIILFSFSDSFSQAGYFLNVVNDARSISFGNAFAADKESSIMMYTNPAAASLNGKKIGVSYANRSWLSDLTDGYNMHSVAVNYKLGEKSSFYIGGRRFNTPQVKQYDESGNFLNNFIPYENSYGLGYAYRMNSTTAMSVTMNYLSSTMSENADAEAYLFDLGFFKSFKTVDLGIVLKNLGSSLAFEDYENISIPLWVDAGMGYTRVLTEKSKVKGLVDLSMINDSNVKTTSFSYSIGAEYNFRSIVSIRSGYYYGNNEIDMSSFSVGCGLELYGARFDFAYILAGEKMKTDYSFSLSWFLKN